MEKNIVINHQFLWFIAGFSASFLRTLYCFLDFMKAWFHYWSGDGIFFQLAVYIIPTLVIIVIIGAWNCHRRADLLRVLCRWTVCMQIMRVIVLSFSKKNEKSKSFVLVCLSCCQKNGIVLCHYFRFHWRNYPWIEALRCVYLVFSFSYESCAVNSHNRNMMSFVNIARKDTAHFVSQIHLKIHHLQ